MSESVDRKAETKEPGEDEEVDRVGSTVEAEVDRDASTQEPSESTRLILHIHPTDNQKLLKGIPNEPQKHAFGQSIILGRGEDVNIFLNDQTASRRHMELSFELQQGFFKVKNIGRQLSVNDLVMTTGGEHCLRPNDVIKIAQLTFTAEIIGGSDNSSFILEFKKGSRGPNAAQGLQHQPVYQLPQYPPQANPFFPGQLPQPYTANPSQVHQPFVQTPLPGYPAMTAVPVAAVAAYSYPASFPVHPISPPGGHGPVTYPIYQQHSPPYGQVPDRREAFQGGGRSASENEDSLIPQLSVEETQPPKLGSPGESFEETNPPKE